MAYKDKDKQREADKARQQRRRDVIKAKGVTNTGCDGQGVTEQRTGIESMIKPKPELTAEGNIRVSKPGDADYVPQCETTRAFIEGRDKRPEAGKRGKDIKCFEDLPPHVQQTIDMMSTTDGKLDQTIKARRTAIAINYQSSLSRHRLYGLPSGVV